MSITTANRDIKSLQPIAQRACELFLSECEKKGVPIFVTEYQRSQERQDYLYCQGRTVSQCVNAGISKSFAEKYCRTGSQVTWTRSSNHTAGYAWDIAVSPPNALYDANIINRAGEVAKELGIEWGGTWKEQDTPHFQVSKDWKEPREEHTVVKTKIELNGKIKEVEAINLDGNNFIKLRDIADEKIIVDYDSARKIPVVKMA